MSIPYRNNSGNKNYQNIFGNNTNILRNSYKIQNVHNEYDTVSKKQEDNIQTENDIDIETLKQDFPDTFSYIIDEINRLKSLDSSLNNLQALNLAIGSNCGSTDNYDMCPVRRKTIPQQTHQPEQQTHQPEQQTHQPEQQTHQPEQQIPQQMPQPEQQIPQQMPQQMPLENREFKEKGNCVGEGCKVEFSKNKTSDLENIVKKLNIDFYSNDRCGFCNKSKKLFTDENVINSMNIKNNQRLPNGANGYPHFYSNTTGRSHTGAPNSVKMLIDKLS